MTVSYGELNGSIIGASLCDAVTRAIWIIRNMRFTFERSQKGNKSNGRPDWVTNADIAAQRMYTKLLHERFPLYGIVGEEEGLRIECKPPSRNLWFSVDPLDGTNAYNRKQSHGIGTMIALMHENRVIAAAVGDVMTGEIYYFRPDSEKIHRLDVVQQCYDQTLRINPKTTLREQYLLLRDPLGNYSPFAQKLAAPQGEDRLFESHEITGGSIGISMARLWKGEVGAALLRPGKQTPWDMCPVIGISKKLGFEFYSLRAARAKEGRPAFIPLSTPAAPTTYETYQDVLVIHESRVPEVRTWCELQGYPFC